MTYTRAIPASRSRILAATSQVALAVAVIAVMSQIAIPIPFSPVPISLGTLAVMGTAVFLTPKRAIVAGVIYAGLGAAGLPIFAGAASGVMIVSFGYVLAYILAAGIIASYARRPGAANPMAAFAVASGASLVVLVVGAAWLVAAMGVSLPVAAMTGIVPFLVGDLIKSIVVSAMLLAVRAHRDA